ncbi:ribonuclease HI family protein [bacterium]|nr:ribonuclease HI family protein [bacterium]
MKTLKIFTDGGARNNPGPAGIGVVVKDIENNVIETYKKYIGDKTNNQAEYEALIYALEKVSGKGDVLECFLDSQLVVNQATGAYKVKNAEIRELLFKVKTLEQDFNEVHYFHIPREQNKEADKLVNEALDEYLSS